MAKHVIHLSELQAAGHFADLVERLRAGEEIVIENDSQPLAVVKSVAPTKRSISESIALAKAHEEETGETPVLDPDFADDMEEVIRRRQTWDPPAWD